MFYYNYYVISEFPESQVSGNGKDRWFDSSILEHPACLHLQYTCFSYVLPRQLENTDSTESLQDETALPASPFWKPWSQSTDDTQKASSLTFALALPTEPRQGRASLAQNRPPPGRTGLLSKLSLQRAVSPSQHMFPSPTQEALPSSK